jgi:hypothetical protein
MMTHVLTLLSLSITLGFAIALAQQDEEPLYAPPTPHSEATVALENSGILEIPSADEMN